MRERSWKLGLAVGLGLAFLFGGAAELGAASEPLASGELKTRLVAAKSRADVGKLKRLVRRRGPKTTLKLGGMAQAVLDPAALMDFEKKWEASRAKRLGRELNKYSNYIKGRDRGAQPPDSVNLAKAQTGVKDQGRFRGTSVAFALVAALEHAYGGGKLDLSEQDAWNLFKGKRGDGAGHCANGVNFIKAVKLLKKYGVLEEGLAPYKPRLDKKRCKDAPAARAGGAKASHGIQRFQALGRGKADGKDAGAFVNNPRLLEAALASDKVVVVGLGVAGTDWAAGARKRIDVQLDAEASILPPVGHQAFALIGYDRNKKSFFAKSSWGKNKGKRGYLELSYDYLRVYASIGAYVVQVKKARKGRRR